MKRKNLAIVMTSALLLVACSGNAPKQAKPELTEERFQQLASNIPDHMMTDDSVFFTPEYYNAWQNAMAIPDGGLGGIGMNEFMFYFVCGNDPCDSHQYKLDSVFIIGDTAYVDFEIVHRQGNASSHTLKLVVCDSQWVIADYDQTLSQMQKYLKEQRIYLKSDEYKGYADEILNDTSASDEWKEQVRKELKEVEEYFSTIE